MTPLRQIRADFDRDTIVMYQAFGPRIADPALAAGRFVAPFSFTRLTWIKPSKIDALVRAGQTAKGQRLLPPERPYPLTSAVARNIQADAT